MDAAFFIQVIAAVIIGNLVTLAFAFAVRRITQHERDTGSSEGAPLWVYLLLILPGAFVAAASMLGKAAL